MRRTGTCGSREIGGVVEPDGMKLRLCSRLLQLGPLLRILEVDPDTKRARRSPIVVIEIIDQGVDLGLTIVGGDHAGVDLTGTEVDLVVVLSIEPDVGVVLAVVLVTETDIGVDLVVVTLSETEFIVRIAETFLELLQMSFQEE